MYYQITEQLAHLESLPEKDSTSAQPDMTAVTFRPEQWTQERETLGFPPYTEIGSAKISSCRAETHPKFISGSLCIPVRDHLLTDPDQFVFFINEHYIIFISKDDLPDRVIGRMIPRYQNQPMTPAFFLYGFFREFLNDDIELLEKYENQIFVLEEKALHGNTVNLMRNILRARRELTRLRNYYEQMEDLAREIMSNDKNYFDADDLEVLEPLCDRADQLQGIAQQAIEYCQTLRDFEQAQSDHKQNKTIEFLTILTSIFFPLTVITGWYGMNFTNMPEVHSKFGYLTVIFVSAAVIVTEFVVLKKKQMV